MLASVFQFLTTRVILFSGIWLPSRLWTFQVAQILAAIIFGVLLIPMVESLIELAESSRQELPDNTPEWVYRFYPTGEDLKSALYPAQIIACAVNVVIIILYIPRYVVVLGFS